MLKEKINSELSIRLSNGPHGSAKKTIQLFFIGLLVAWFGPVFFIGCGGSYETEKDINTNMGYVQGKISDADSQIPIIGALITSASNSNTTSDSNGAYSIILPTGVCTIQINAQGYNSVEMSDIDVFKNEVTIRNVAMTADGTNTPPDQPLLATPSDGAIEASLRPELTTQPFADADDGDVHNQSRWQTAKDPSFDDSTLIVDISSKDALTTLYTELIFDSDTTYYWRVRFFDNHNAFSVWSEPFSFTTAIDTDRDKMPDRWENLNGLDPTINDAEQDPDNDGFTNLEEYCLGTDPWQPPAAPDAVIMGFVRGTVVDSRSGKAVVAQLLTSSGIVAESSQAGDYFMVHPTGTYNVVASAEGYYRATYTFEVSETATALLNVELPPTKTDGSPSSGGVGGGGGCFIEISRFSTQG